ncbi:helix-turn-helix domain-containing protein [Sphingosinicella sp. LHD-64]|uniref:winged helix-turn-helix transcriptional regulator n=1 Tax=Sphingosinicella sp. LHD-64 TaxID=3072139 RepID=UPI0028104A27|nr:helix-turn-helix domain-containing protein [Sphingosinicella sp. LHD-64]MDQ8756840.1 helix-turn-helix domain-containing protein [Sphingosinicella sp. LHD-64]
MKLQNITDSENGPSRRRYEDACGTAHALDLIGERWALLVMRELMMGPKRFGDLRADLPGISANVLTQRLEGLEAAGIVVKRQLPPPAAVQVYELTEWGYQSKPIMGALGRWATRSPLHDPTLHLSAVSLMLSFQAMNQPARHKDLTATIGFRLGRESYVLRLEEGAIDATRGDPDGADLVFTGAARAVAAAVYGGVPLATLEAEGALAIAGDHILAERFITFFPLPPKAPQPV